ncbi:hypothetical protein FJT64_015163 [Amphibalanus amphitrite]|uniref:G-protein coupled receptors family 1 profile domain-containing protein n=1 Tax=Amphibalanus amphitrite TaxID=1232801 RepID=A0A6A4XH98_AMPAM|nr:hypothetical protein FJT64_015163 [Amphibalanus amphitrite]
MSAADRGPGPAPLAEPEHRPAATAYLFGYSVLIPVISALGVVGNALNLLVLTHGRRHLRHSIYVYFTFRVYFTCESRRHSVRVYFTCESLRHSVRVYFTFLSLADLVTCLLVLFSGIAKGVAADSVWWQLFDVYLHLGCGAVSTTASVATVVMVTVERLVTISRSRLARWYCTRPVAWRVCRVIVAVSIAFNIPYFLPFTVDADDGIRPTAFYFSRYYQVHNWVRFAVLGVGAALFLGVGNLVLLVSLRRSCARRRTLLSQRKHWEERRLKVA